MKRLWFLVFLLPASVTGCMHLPDDAARLKTEQKGPPPQINANLPANQKAGADAANPAPANTPVPSGKGPGAATKGATIPVSADQIHGGNVYEKFDALQQEVGADYNSD